MGRTVKPAVSSEFKEIAFGDLHSLRIRAFDAIWRAKAGTRPCPARSDIDPAEIKPLLPYFVLVDIEYGPFRVRYRLCGSKVAAYDEELTNRYLDEIQYSPAGERDLIARSYQLACKTQQPVYCRGITHSPKTLLRLSYEGGIWPLSSDGRVVDKCAAIEDLMSLQDL